GLEPFGRSETIRARRQGVVFSGTKAQDDRAPLETFAQSRGGTPTRGGTNRAGEQIRFTEPRREPRDLEICLQAAARVRRIGRLAEQRVPRFTRDSECRTPALG